ncbi:hypothetical protein [Bacillus wiedmannii]|uniref:hypothetical protein n=1 Tax=Bacillus wiedmannii TaxID=1890302 RepID=UPI000BF3391E|nr:hypothetical protein [Bacillus wiedmannii]PGD94988.1 hypothetical protein COM48_14660 [Bacillus wiedmannii]
MSLTDKSEWLKYDESCNLLGLKLEGDQHEAVKKMNELFELEEVGIYSKLKIEKFLREHISIANVITELRNLVDKNLGSLHGRPNNLFINKPLKSLGLEVIRFAKFFESKFISLNEFEIIKHYYKKIYNHPDAQICLTKEFVSALQLGLERHKEKIVKIFKQYDIEPYFTCSRVNYYKKEDLDFLKAEQKKQFQLMEKSYLTIVEACELYGFKEHLLKRHLRDKGLMHHTVEFPLICSVQNQLKKYNVQARLVPKRIVEDYVKLLKQKKDVENILNNVDIMPYQCYEKLMDYFEIKFPEEARLTEKYWFSFTRLKLEETIRSGAALKEFTSMLFSITKSIVEMCNNGEIFSFSEKEIAFMLFNDNVPNHWQRQIYNFLNRLNSTLELNGLRVIDLKRIPNPKHKKVLQKEKETYSVKEYLNLIDYSNKYFQKSKALIDAKSQIEGERFFSYSNMWLYTIIHLNNAWRHSDVLTFPRLTIRQFDHLTLEWLENNELSQGDAELIADFYRSQAFTHSKNGKKRYFIISDELLLSFAEAVAVCECIYRELYPLSDRIIGFQNKHDRILEAVHSSFFADYKSDSEDFEFRSSIMNRTVISLGTDVISKLSDDNAIDAIKFFRNHSNIEITNIYIDIPPEYLNRIADNLFNLGNFGYIYDALSTLLFGVKSNREARVQNASMVEEIFGAIARIETIAHCALEIASEREQVKDFLNALTPEERLKKYNLLNWGLSPSKSYDLQCLVGIDNCPMGVMDCDKCSLKVPNRFTLCNLYLKIHDKIEAFIQIYENTNLEGEKVKVSNQLYMIYDLLKQAIYSFGRETVSHFIDLDSINKIMGNLPSFKQHVSLIQEGGIEN